MVEGICDSELTNNRPVHQCNGPIIAIEYESIDLYLFNCRQTNKFCLFALSSHQAHITHIHIFTHTEKTRRERALESEKIKNKKIIIDK